MKLLVVAISQHRPKTFANKTLKLISRAGYDYRIYLKKSEAAKYRAAMAKAEDQHYLFVPEENIFEMRNNYNLPKYITKTEYNNYDLLLEVPDDIKMKGARGIDNQLLLFCKEVGSLRNKFNKNSELCVIDGKRIHKDAYMVRLR